MMNKAKFFSMSRAARWWLVSLYLLAPWASRGDKQSAYPTTNTITAKDLIPILSTNAAGHFDNRNVSLATLGAAVGAGGLSGTATNLQVQAADPTHLIMSGFTASTVPWINAGDGTNYDATGANGTYTNVTVYRWAGPNGYGLSVDTANCLVFLTNALFHDLGGQTVIGLATQCYVTNSDSFLKSDAVSPDGGSYIYGPANVAKLSGTTTYFGGPSVHFVGSVSADLSGSSNSLTSAEQYALSGNLSNSVYLRDLAAAMPTTPPLFSSWNYFSGFPPSSRALEDYAIGTAQNMSTNGYIKFFRPIISLDEGWQSAIRDGSGNITWDTTKIPDGIPTLVGILATNGCDLELYLSVGGGCVSGIGTDLPHEAQDITKLISWGVHSAKMDYCNGAHTIALQFPDKEDYFKLETRIANNTISANTTADGSADYGSPLKTFLLHEIVFDTISQTRQCPFEAKMMVNIPAFAGSVAFNSSNLTNDLYCLRLSLPSNWICGPGVMREQGSTYQYYSQNEFALLAEAPFLASCKGPAGGSASSGATWTNVAWLSAYQDPAMLPCSEVSSNALLEVFNRPMGGLYTQDKLAMASNCRATNCTVTLSAALLGLSSNMVYEAQDIWNGTNCFFTGGFNTTVSSSNVMQFRVSIPTNAFTGSFTAGSTTIAVTNGLIFGHSP